MSAYRDRRRKRRHGASHFALIPFIDMMTILVVFLLAHTAEVDILPNTKNIPIPQSLSDRQPNAAVVVMVTKDSVFVDGRLVGSVEEVAANTGPVFEPLKAALMAKTAAAPAGSPDATPGAAALGAATPQTDIAKREVTIIGDKNMPYSLLKRIMVTCSDAEYGKVSFAVAEREQAAT
jgi:biopolymer transport protein ExbD